MPHRHFLLATGPDAEMTCYCSILLELCAKNPCSQILTLSQFLLDNLSGRYEESYAASLVTNKPLIYKHESTVCVISVLNKTNGHLSCAVRALYEIGVYFDEAQWVVRNHLLMAHNVIEHSFWMGGNHNVTQSINILLLCPHLGSLLWGNDEGDGRQGDDTRKQLPHLPSSPPHPSLFFASPQPFNTTATNYPLCLQYYQGWSLVSIIRVLVSSSLH